MVINIALLQPHVQHIFPVSAAIPPRCVLNQVLDALWELWGLVHRDDAFTWAPGKPKRGDSKRGRSVGKCGKLIYMNGYIPIYMYTYNINIFMYTYIQIHM